MPPVAAIATAFHPDERLAAVVEAALKSCTEVVVVDNTPAGQPSAAESLADLAGVRVLRSGRNVGLAAALNAGVRELGADAQAVLFLDQDSVLAPDLVEALVAHLAADPAVAVAAPAPWDAGHDRYYEPGTAARPDVADRDTVITSGMLVRRSVLERIGGFREEFFVDHVDNDFCLRVRASGGRIVQDKRCKLVHSLGTREKHRVAGATFSSSRHPVWRNYWIARNATILIREHRRTAPAWTRGTCVYLQRWFLCRLVFEAPRSKRAAAMLQGFADGLRGRVTESFYPEGAVRPERTPAA
jgi:rhamnosyltransferase